MKLITRVSDMKKWTKLNRKYSVGFVPTMGALHEGHLSLIRAAKKENKKVVVSIFINPAQFGPNEDLKNYPKRFSSDKKILSNAGVDKLFFPRVKEIYPEGYQTEVKLNQVTKSLCGKFRPVHFGGVATIVTKLFNIVGPEKAYFGAKDYQQSVVIRQLVKDLNFPVQVRVLPTVREKDGLAMSSRNAYLSTVERMKAPLINLALEYAQALVTSGVKQTSSLKSSLREFLGPFINRIEYIEFVHPEKLVPMSRIQGTGLLAIACYIGKSRLIDNRLLKG